MKKIPFDEKEISIRYTIPNRRSASYADIPHYEAPLTARENIKAAIFEKDCLYMPDFRDYLFFTPRCIPDNVARCLLLDGGTPLTPNGGKDMFGITWIYVEVAQGAMVRPGNPLFTDINDWENKIDWPDIDSWDWEGQKTISTDFLKKTERAVVPTIFSGYFERLISLMDMENACVAMIDEDQEEALQRFFEKLTDLYCRIIDRLTEYFPIDGICVHDDWGSQRAPFFSLQTVQNILVPHMKRLADHIHSKNLFFDLHSCGQIEILVPAMLEIGVDSWSGQPMNDKNRLYEKYGDKLLLGIETPAIPAEMGKEKIAEIAREFADRFTVPGKPVMISGRSEIENPYFFEEIYRYTRRKYAEIDL